MRTVTRRLFRSHAQRPFSFCLSSSSYAFPSLHRSALTSTLGIRRYAVPTASARVVFPGQENERVEIQWPEKDVGSSSLKLNGHSTVSSSSMLSRQLRDFCSCSRCRHPDTNQRLVDSFSLPGNLHVVSVSSEAAGLKVTWSSENGGSNEGHESVYDWNWLRSKTSTAASSSSSSSSHSSSISNLSSKPILWTSSVHEDPPSVPFDEVMSSDGGVQKWVRNIRLWGFSYVDGCPVDPQATEKLLERISFIRQTHYGGFWDFTSDLSSKDMAYTTLELGAHTDTTYFSDPAGLQMFHLLEHTGGEGGKSLLVDGFRAARVLWEEDPDAVRALHEVKITAHATGNDDAKIITPKAFSVLDYHPEAADSSSLPSSLSPSPSQSSSSSSSSSPCPSMVQIRWNNDDRGSFATTDPAQISRWYRAARKWNAILHRPESQYWSQLEPGRPLIFDNWRVLHGRSAFTGRRRLCGGYVNMDDFLSRWRRLELSEGEVVLQI